MLFAIICSDNPESLDIRLANRSDHLAYLDTLGDDLIAAGPFVDGDGNPNGSLVIIKAKDLNAAKQFAAGDPYAKAGLFARVEVRSWRWLINNPLSEE